ncbi:hypothetical protein K456DRAFT_953777 [Colletotrichum gloeosporioides 23]|nr:hypothetical protein K456DRAFT_953777 [Colletotrichum gloeosporioides 23]
MLRFFFFFFFFVQTSLWNSRSVSGNDGTRGPDDTKQARQPHLAGFAYSPFPHFDNMQRTVINRRSGYCTHCLDWPLTSSVQSRFGRQHGVLRWKEPLATVTSQPVEVIGSIGMLDRQVRSRTSSSLVKHCF